MFLTSFSVPTFLPPSDAVLNFAADLPELRQPLLRNCLDTLHISLDFQGRFFLSSGISSTLKMSGDHNGPEGFSYNFALGPRF